MASIINVSIDLSKIDKSKISKADKNGSQYYTLQIFVNDAADKYGNTVSVADAQTKEQREAKEPKKYIGNGKVVWNGQTKKEQPQTQPLAQANEDDGLPF